MSSGGSSSPVVTQTQTRDPWSVAQPYLAGMYSAADVLRAGNQGWQPYTGPTQAALDPQLSAAMQGAYGLAANQSAWQGIPQAEAGAQNIINQQGITPGIQGALGGLGDVAQRYKDIYAQAQGQQNPYLQQILDTQNRMIGDRINAAMSGAGRYGSGAHTDVMARGLAEAEAPLLQQDYEARQARMQQAAGALGQTYGGIADIYGKGLQQAGQYAQLLPGLLQAQYKPFEMQQQIGTALQDRAQQDLNAQIQLFNAQQQYPWQQLQRESAILAGAGQLGGTTVSGQTTQVPWTQRLLGGAVAGGGLGSAFGPAGAGIGALGGGLLGLL